MKVQVNIMTSNDITAVSKIKATVELHEESFIADEGGIGLSVAYKLILIELPFPMYVLIGEMNGEYSGVCVGSDRLRAREIFSAVCDGGVTPFVLDETVRDLDMKMILK